MMPEPVLPSHTSSGPAPSAPAPLDTMPDEMPVPMPTHLSGRVYQGLAFALSAVLSPYLVIPVGTVGIVASQEIARHTLLFWTLLSVFFSTGIPALYVVWQMILGNIGDVHVMEREQRGGPFLVAIFSSALGAWALKQCGAPSPVWSLGVVLSVNGVVMLWITSFWKISIHVAVLSATVLASLILIPGIPKRQLLLLIPALIWARVTRGKHSIWQGIGGCGVACVVTLSVLYGLRSLYDLNFWWA